jgi:hypothetical protein
MPKGTDKGFEFAYFRLSYRRKFIRTLWTMGIIVVWYFAQPLMPSYLPNVSLYLVLGFLFAIPQAIYNYVKWKAEDRSER